MKITIDKNLTTVSKMTEAKNVMKDLKARKLTDNDIRNIVNDVFNINEYGDIIDAYIEITCSPFADYVWVRFWSYYWNEIREVSCAMNLDMTEPNSSTEGVQIRRFTQKDE